MSSPAHTCGVVSLSTITLLVGAAVTAAHGGTTRFVNGGCGSDDWSGLSPVCQAPDGPKATIQAGIDASNHGDTVVVADGTYTGDGNRNTSFDGRLITLRSENGPDRCVIDCEGAGRGFLFRSGETSAAVVTGFTIANGYAAEGAGGGMYISDSSPTVGDCVFSGNLADEGGGMFNSNAGTSVTQCIFANNTAVRHGGGMYNEYSDLVITDCTFTRNVADLLNGGAIYNEFSDLTVRRCRFERNAVNNVGAGMANFFCDLRITHCAFNQNDAICHGTPTIDCSAAGGGMGNYDCSAVITNCTFTGNRVSCGSPAAARNGWTGAPNRSPDATLSCHGLGGGIDNRRTNATITNCTFGGNIGGEHGGGVYIQDNDPILTNCTFSRNSSVFSGGAVFAIDSSHPSVNNCIVWENHPNEIVSFAGSEATVTYSDVQGGFPGKGNIDVDPLFANDVGIDGIAGTTDDDLRLLPDSPAINAGDLLALPPDVPDLDGDGDTKESAPLDLDGHARVLCGEVDMGPYEFGIGDFDCDADVDVTDYAAYLQCVTGPGGGAPVTGCDAFDFEVDADVDLADLCRFQLAFTGSP